MRHVNLHSCSEGSDYAIKKRHLCLPTFAEVVRFLFFID